jgi:hypothetical protein
MSLGLKASILSVAALAFCSVSPSATARETARKEAQAQRQAQSSEPAIILVRVRKDGEGCRGVARLRPFKGGELDMSRFVDIGYVTSIDSKAQLQALGEFIGQGITLDFKTMFADTNKSRKDQFVSIAPGTYVMTNILCEQGRTKTWIGSDHSNLFAAETGRASPIKGANIIDVRAGEILDAGVLEIRSDAVGFFETKTASVVAAPTPENEQAQLREIFQSAGKKLRFSTFRAGAK